jgi:hypothetical protein
MALIIKDRVQETSTTSGTGTITLAGAVTGYQSFASAIGSGNTTYYAIYESQTVNWEVGVGTVGSGTLARTTVLASSNGGSLVSFGGNQLAVWGDMPAAKGLYIDYVGTVSGLSIGGNAATVTNGVYTTDTGTVTNTMLAGSIANSKLQNSSITINGNATALGGSVSVGTVTSVTGTSPISSSGGTTPAISISQATASTNGYLSSTDWNTFNNKQPAGTYVTSVTGTSGRITSSGGTTPAIDLVSGVATPGTTGSSTLIPVITIDTYGRVTSITTASNPQGTVTSVSGTGTVNGISLSGAVTSSGSLTLGGAIDLTGVTINGGSF